MFNSIVMATNKTSDPNYYINNLPNSEAWYVLLTFRICQNLPWRRQIAFELVSNTNKFYSRTYNNNDATWSDWIDINS